MLKSACQAGGCGARSAVLSDGRVEMGEHDPDVIETPEEDGGILLCRSFPRGGCRIELPYDRGQVVTAPPTRHQARIVGLNRVADAVMRLRLSLVADTDGSSSADFESGQFVRITVPGSEARRAYSFANVANWDGELEFYIRLLSGGLMIPSPPFRFDTVVWRPDPEWTGATGNPVELAAAEAALLDEWPDVHVCGPPPMVEAAYAELTAVGIPHDQIHAERFSAVE